MNLSGSNYAVRSRGKTRIPEEHAKKNHQEKARSETVGSQQRGGSSVEKFKRALKEFEGAGKRSA